jgi:hypothetical protein
MGAASQASKVDDHGDQEPHKVDPLRRHAAIELPCINDRCDRKENKAEQRQQQAGMESSLQVRREKPHQNEHDARKQQDGQKQEAGHRHLSSRAVPRQCDDNKSAEPPMFAVLNLIYSGKRDIN